MAKKKQEVVINQEELSKTVLGPLNERKGNLSFLIVMFLLFIVAIFVSPYVSKYIETKKSENKDIVNDSYSNNDIIEVKPDDTESVKYEIKTYASNMSLEIDNLFISNLSILDSTLSYQITNKGTSGLDLVNNKYFLEFYNNDTLVARRKLEAVKLAKAEAKEFSYAFAFNEINGVSLVKKTTDEYPFLELVTDENKIGNISCTYKDYIIDYKFNDNKLYNIKEEIKINLFTDDYFESYEKYNAILNNYNGYTGYSGSFDMDDAYITFEFALDLNYADISLANNAYYYKKDTTASVVKFEMESQGFECK